MIEWFTIAMIAWCVLAGSVSLVSGARGAEPRDLTVLSTLGTEVLLVVQVVLAIVQPLSNNPITGDPIEYWMYLGTALLMVPAVVVWAIVDKTRWGTLALGGISLSIAVMVIRMSVIWAGS